MKHGLGGSLWREASKRLRRSRADTDDSQGDRTNTEASPAGSLSYFGLDGEFITSAPNHDVARSEILRRERYPTRRRVHIQPLGAPARPGPADGFTHFQVVVSPLTVLWSINMTEDDRRHDGASVALDEDYESAEKDVNYESENGAVNGDREVIICQIAGARAAGRDLSTFAPTASTIEYEFDGTPIYTYEVRRDASRNFDGEFVIHEPCKVYGVLEVFVADDSAHTLAEGRVELPHQELSVLRRR